MKNYRGILFRISLLVFVVSLTACDSQSRNAGKNADTTSLTQGLATLEQSVTRLKDINELKRLQRIYGYYIDRSEWDQVVDLLTDDASAEYGQSGVYVGKEHIRAMLYAIGYGERGLQPHQLREHIQLQPVITLSADGLTAKARWRGFVLLGQYEEYARWQLGPYENEYRKVDGKWQISKLHWAETFTVPYEGGWTTKMEMTNVADRNFPEPDLPPTFKYEPWPGVHNLAYHYDHPVTGTSTEVAAAVVEQELSSEQAQLQLAQLQHEVQLLEDERDVEILQRTYGYYVDKNLWAQIGDLFALEGTLEIGGRGIFVGKERAQEYLEWLGEPEQGRLYDHTQMQGVVNVSPDGTQAKGRWRALVWGGNDGGASIFGDCIYENEYVKEDGVWKIAKLHAYFIMYTMWEQGWGARAWPNTRPEKVLPPDLPPTVVYDMYPGELTAPYHYENPVTGKPAFNNSDIVYQTPADVDSQSIQTQLISLQERANKLSDIQQVERLQNAVGYYFDQRQWDDVADSFANNATSERDQRGVYIGKDSIRNSLALYGEGKTHGNVYEHLLYQPIIHIGDDGKSAKARLRTFDLAGDYQGDATISGGVFENTYVKENDVWKIQSDHLYTTFTADYKKGWAHGAIPVVGRSEKIPPDAPPTFEYQAFPTYYVFPFHYPNPVTGKDPLSTE